jgi:hypothetical protein
MISGPMPSPWATVIGVFVGIRGITKINGKLRTAQPEAEEKITAETPRCREMLWLRAD